MEGAAGHDSGYDQKFCGACSGHAKSGWPDRDRCGARLYRLGDGRLLRAFDTETGAELWKGRLPAGAQAMPMTYRAGRDDKQFVVIAAGGHGKLGTKLGDSLIAFALP